MTDSRLRIIFFLLAFLLVAAAQTLTLPGIHITDSSGRPAMAQFGPGLILKGSPPVLDTLVSTKHKLVWTTGAYPVPFFPQTDASSIDVYRNGVLQDPEKDYTLNGTVVFTIVPTLAWDPSDVVFIRFRHA